MFISKYNEKLQISRHGLPKDTQNVVQLLYACKISCHKDRRDKNWTKTDLFTHNY